MHNMETFHKEEMFLPLQGKPWLQFLANLMHCVYFKLFLKNMFYVVGIMLTKDCNGLSACYVNQKFLNVF